MRKSWPSVLAGAPRHEGAAVRLCLFQASVAAALAIAALTLHALCAHFVPTPHPNLSCAEDLFSDLLASFYRLPATLVADVDSTCFAIFVPWPR
eukprot:1021621-Pleurochrysis_carterae.AAC.1